jgi:hypothetical protein
LALRRGTLDANRNWQSVPICDCHDLCALSTFCLSELRDPFLAGAKLASMKASREVTLATSTLLQMVVPDTPQNLIGDNAYDSDHLDAELKFYGIAVIAPHRRTRRIRLRMDVG